jgi:hypothetical protein
MEKDIQQPNMPRPDLKDPDRWAAISVVRNAWLRQIAPQLGIDPIKQVLGETLADIVGDDANLFAWADVYYFGIDVVNNSKKGLNIRLKNEIDTPEIPEKITIRLKIVRDKVNAIDWTSKEGFKHARDEWFKVRNWVRNEIDNNDILRDAERYANQNSVKLSPYWDRFIYGSDSYK